MDPQGDHIRGPGEVRPGSMVRGSSRCVLIYVRKATGEQAMEVARENMGKVANEIWKTMGKLWQLSFSYRIIETIFMVILPYDGNYHFPRGLSFSYWGKKPKISIYCRTTTISHELGIPFTTQPVFWDYMYISWYQEMFYPCGSSLDQIHAIDGIFNRIFSGQSEGQAHSCC